MRYVTLAAVAAAVLAAPVSAGVKSIGPFAGAFEEGFEGIPFGDYASLEVFDGNGIASPIGDESGVPDLSVIFAINLGSTLTALSGTHMMGTSLDNNGMSPAVRWTFPTPARRFGGFFGTVDFEPGGTAFLFDAANNLIAEVALDVPIRSWSWNGWESDVGIARVDVFGNGIFGPGLVFYDQMEFDPVPGPPGLVILAGLAVRRSRRRRS